ncbi:MAG: hypothetical protein QUV05_07650 [Phycisphaerae bacterium]|jgi:hypothetical protein|nr:hypothetical protein [Phycisphaerae bacterium]
MIRVSKFRRPNGYWYVRYWSGAQPLDESARTKSESQAETYRLRREIEINAGKLEDPPIKHEYCVVWRKTAESLNAWHQHSPPIGRISR